VARIESLHHAAVTVPTERLEEARHFYANLLGLEEAPRPEAELGRPGIWYRVGGSELHIQARDNYVRELGAHHSALVVDDVSGLKAHLQANDIEIEDAQPLSDRERFFARDPFGNRLEFLSRPE